MLLAISNSMVLQLHLVCFTVCSFVAFSISSLIKLLGSFVTWFIFILLMPCINFFFSLPFNVLDYFNLSLTKFTFFSLLLLSSSLLNMLHAFLLYLLVISFFFIASTLYFLFLLHFTSSYWFAQRFLVLSFSVLSFDAMLVYCICGRRGDS